MAHQHAALHYPVIIIFGQTRLEHHFFYSRKRGVDVIRGVRKLASEGVVGVFEVGKVHVDKPVENTQRFRRGVAAAIVHDRYLGAINAQAFGDSLGKVVGCDQIDIVDTALLKSFVSVGKLTRGKGNALARK